MLIGYARTSTADQSLDLQMDALKKAGVDPRHVFTDQASGRKNDRDGFRKALQFCKPGDTLVAWRLDRVGRSTKHLLSTITDLASAGVEFRSLTENIDTTTPAGRMFLGFAAVMAEFESDLISERIKAGLAAAALRGQKFGKPLAIPEAVIDAAIPWLDGGSTKTAVAVMFGVKRQTLIDGVNRRKLELAKAKTEGKA